MKSKLYKRMIKIKNPFKNCELEDKVKGDKANLTKLIRINKAKHFNNYFLENKKNLLNTCDGIRGVININKRLSKDIKCLQVNKKTISDIKEIENEFKIHFTTLFKKIEEKLISSEFEFMQYLPQPSQD